MHVVLGVLGRAKIHLVEVLCASPNGARCSTYGVVCLRAYILDYKYDSCTKTHYSLEAVALSFRDLARLNRSGSELTSKDSLTRRERETEGI